jgi:hypothetical protein
MYVTASQVTSTGYTMIALTSIFSLARFGARYYKQTGVQIEDFFVLLSWVVFIAMAIMYVVVTPVMYKISAMEQGEQVYTNLEQLEEDALYMIKIFFVNTMLLWVVLWSVKLSLLMLYRRLFKGLPAQMRWWWLVLVFTLLVRENDIKQFDVEIELMVVANLIILSRHSSVASSPISHLAGIFTTGSLLVRTPQLSIGLP